MTIRESPGFDFSGRDQKIVSGPAPLWFSFDTSFGLFHRVESTVQPDFYQTSQFMPRGNLEPSLTSDFHWGSFSIIPGVTMHETFYGQSLINGTPSRKRR